jgi:hypothetical protein
MTENVTRGEAHGCIVCGRLYQLLVVYDKDGKFMDLKVMTEGGKPVTDQARPLVACTRHTDKEIERAVERVYGPQRDEE